MPLSVTISPNPIAPLNGTDVLTVIVEPIDNAVALALSIA